MWGKNLPNSIFPSLLWFVKIEEHFILWKMICKRRLEFSVLWNFGLPKWYKSVFRWFAKCQNLTILCIVVIWYDMFYGIMICRSGRILRSMELRFVKMVAGNWATKVHSNYLEQETSAAKCSIFYFLKIINLSTRSTLVLATALEIILTFCRKGKTHAGLNIGKVPREQ